MGKLLFRWLVVLVLLQPMMIQADVPVETNSLRLQFSDQGDLLRAEACFPDCQQSDAKTRVLSAQKGMFVLGSEASPGLQFERSREPSATILEWSDADTQVLRRWSVPDHGWVLSLTTQGADQAELSSGEDFRPAQSSGFGYLLEQTRYLVFDGEDVAVTGLDDDVQADHKASGWFGFRNRFWTAMIMPDADLMVRLATGEELSDAQVTVQLDSNMPQHMQLYLGPIEPLSLKRTAPELENLMYSGLWFWLRWICQALYYLLSGIVMVIPQWGPAVMVLSVIVGLLMRPLSKIADRLQDQVHEIDARLAPTLAAIKKDYKGAEQSEKIIAMYKEEGVHPLYSLKSLMGVFVVIPVFIGAFDMLAENIHLSGEAFLWISDLSNPDAFLQMPFSLPFFGGYLNLLPFIMTGFSFVASKLHAHPAMDAAQQRKQSRNLVLMSLGFLVLFYTFPAGMVLYWTTNNLISVIKMLWKRRKINAVSDQ
jgi:YidC/Oxa1 family membrane protein insertase